MGRDAPEPGVKNGSGDAELLTMGSRLATIMGVVGAVLLAGLWAVAPGQAAVTSAAAWQTGDPTFTPPTRKPAIQGVVYHGVWSDHTDSVRARILDDLAAGGVKYVRMDISWAQIQPTGPGSYDMAYAVPMIDQRLAEITARGMKALLLFHWAPAWSSGTTAMNGVPRDPVEFGVAAAWAANRWQSSLAGIELLNEPDSSAFLADTSPVTYTKLITAAYPRIKAVAPDLTVVAGAPMYVKTSWYTQFYANGGADNYDALGIHPYIAVTDQPPSTCETNQWMEYYPCNIPHLVKLMADNGDADKKIWATEYGWSSHDESSYSSPVPNWKRGTTEAEQAQFLIDMQNYVGQWPQVEAMFWYTSWNKNTGDQMEDNWGLLKRDFTRKPAYFAMKCVASGICGPGSTSAPSPTTASPTPTATPSPTTTTPAPTTAPLVRRGATWRINDTGKDLGTTWRATAYSDSTWRTGAAQLGYGDGDEATVLRYGTNASKKYPTYYARTSFDLASLPSTGLTLELLADDGAVVYLNGTEVLRQNMPTGTIRYATYASSNVSGAAESAWRSVAIPATALKTGKNVLAIEVHNDAANSSDISLDASLSVR